MTQKEYQMILDYFPTAEKKFDVEIGVSGNLEFYVSKSDEPFNGGEFNIIHLFEPLFAKNAKLCSDYKEWIDKWVVNLTWDWTKGEPTEKDYKGGK